MRRDRADRAKWYSSSRACQVVCAGGVGVGTAILLLPLRTSLQAVAFLAGTSDCCRPGTATPGGRIPSSPQQLCHGEACCAAWHSFWQGHVMLLLPILVVCVIPKNSLVACPRHTGLCCHAPNAGWVGGIRHLHARLHGGAADVIASTLLLSCNT